MSKKESKAKEDNSKKPDPKSPEPPKSFFDEDDLTEEEPETIESTPPEPITTSSSLKVTEIPLIPLKSEPEKPKDPEKPEESKSEPPKKATKSTKPSKTEIKAKLDSTSTVIQHSKITLEPPEEDADESTENEEESVRAEINALKHQIITGETSNPEEEHPHIERAKSEKITVKIQIGDKIKEETVSPYADVFCVVCRGYDKNEKRYCYRYLDQLTISQAEKFQNFLIKYGCMCGEQTDIIITLKSVLDDLNNAFPIHIRKFEEKFIEYFHKKIVIPSISIQP